MYAQIQKPDRGKLKNSLELRYIHIHDKDSTGVIEITRDWIENGNGFYGDGSADAARDAVVWKQQVNRQPELIKVDVDFFVGFILLKNGNPGKRIASSMLDGISMLNLTRRGLLSQMTADARDVIFQDLLRTSGLEGGDIESLVQQKPSVVKGLFDIYPNLEVIVSPNGDFPFREASIKREQLYNCAYLRHGLRVDIVNQSGTRPVRIIE